MQILTRYNTGIVILIIISITFFIFYNPEYPPVNSESFEVNSPELDQRVLIASQPSQYKNTVVHSIVRQLKQRPVYIKVIDVTALPDISEKNWNVIIVIHTWEYWQPPPPVQTWLEQVSDLGKVVVLTTSGNGTSRMKDINAVTSASVMANIPVDVTELLSRVDFILQNSAGTKQPPIN